MVETPRLQAKNRAAKSRQLTNRSCIALAGLYLFLLAAPGLTPWAFLRRRCAAQAPKGRNMTAQGESPGVGVARLKSPEGATQMDRPLVGLEPTRVESFALEARVVRLFTIVQVRAQLSPRSFWASRKFPIPWDPRKSQRPLGQCAGRQNQRWTHPRPCDGREHIVVKAQPVCQ
jgi:hypothetical protein